MEIVFEGPVRSGFLPPKRATGNRNQLQLQPPPHTTGLNRSQPVHFGPVRGCQLVSTGLLQDRLKPVETSLDRFSVHSNILFTNYNIIIVLEYNIVMP